MFKNTSLTLTLPLAFLASSLANAQVSAPPGFSVDVYDVGTEIGGLAPAPPGLFGEGIYAGTDGQVLQIDLITGAFWPFATGLGTGNNRPSGLVFDEGTFAPFGQGLMYVVQNDGVVQAVAANGTVTAFSGSGLLKSCNDLAFADPGGAYGPYLLVTNGTFGWGEIAMVDSAGTASILSGASHWSWQSSLGLAFPRDGSTFKDILYVADTTDQRIVQVQADGTVTSFAAGLAYPVDVAFPPQGSPFGDYLYYTDASTNEVRRIDPAGQVTTWAKGFNFPSTGVSGDLSFDFFGEALYVANGQEVIRISGRVDLPFCFSNGLFACPCGNDGGMLGREGCLNSTGLGAGLMASGSESIAADDLVLDAYQMPPGQFCALFSGDGFSDPTLVGDGIVCIGGNITLLGVVQATGTGQAGWGPGLGSMGGWLAGDTRQMQVWYRDPGSPCGTTYNVTSAVQLTFVP